VDARSDIFSFGSVLYEMLTGRRAFRRESLVSTLAAILHTEPPPLPAEVPDDLNKVIARCLRKDVARRYQHMGHVKFALEELKEESESGKLAGIPASARKHARPWVWAAAAAVAALLLATAAVWRLREASPASDLTAVPLSSYSGFEDQPTFSPDGGKVAYQWKEKQGVFDIYVKQIGAPGPPMRLTSGPAAKGYPKWSPDDRWIAFAWVEPGHIGITLIPPLGGPERKLTEAMGSLGLCWTPDGKWLVFSEGHAEYDYRGSISAINVDTNERRSLTTFQSTARPIRGRFLGDEHPSISPDGRSLAFARRVRDVQELYMLPLTRDLRPAGQPTKVADQRYGVIVGIAWTADSREIVYSAGGGGTESLWRVAVSGRQTPRRLPYAAPAAYYPVIAPRPPRLAYIHRDINENLWRLDMHTGERKMLIGSPYSAGGPQYSPDGRKIAFHANWSFNWEAWTCDADGANCQQLTAFGGPACGSPSWSPDGHWLALDSNAEGWSEIYVVAADGGPVRRVTNWPGFSNTRPSWSHDGRWIYFSSDHSGRNETWKIPWEGGQAVQVTRSGGGRALESADGKYIYYVKDPGSPGLFRMSAEGGEEQQVAPGNVASGSFSVTRKGVYFTTDEKTIQLLDAATGKVSTLAIPHGAGSILPEAVSPDDTYMVSGQVDRNIQELMLVEGFR
jgi:Tol biopolymer transport system component